LENALIRGDAFQERYMATIEAIRVAVPGRLPETIRTGATTWRHVADWGTIYYDFNAQADTVTILAIELRY
jgi:hypothetical protein